MEGKRKGGMPGKRKGMEKWEGEKGQGKGRLDLDICPGAPEFLAMPLLPSR